MTSLSYTRSDGPAAIHFADTDPDALVAQRLRTACFRDGFAVFTVADPAPAGRAPATD